jgi:hypothetical protein
VAAVQKALMLPIFIPSAGRTEATAALPEATIVDVSHHPAAYPVWLGQRWDIGAAFVSVEHDVMPTAAQIDSLVVCENPWCCYEYDGGVATPFPPIGLVKVGVGLIAATPAMWTDYLGRRGQRRNPDTHRIEVGSADADTGLPPYVDDAPWLHCDEWLAAYARRAGFEPCIHGTVTHCHG